MRKFIAKFRERANALNEDEKGLETIEMILIAVLIVGIIIGVVSLIFKSLTKKGEDVNNQILNLN